MSVAIVIKSHYCVCCYCNRVILVSVAIVIKSHSCVCCYCNKESLLCLLLL